MTELTFDDPCLLFALRREARPFFREFPVQEPFPGAPCWARFCGPAWLPVLVLESGLGAAATKTALDWVLERPALGNVVYRPKLVISAGFSGALQDGLHVGDVILATEVCDAAGKRWPTTWPGDLPAGPWRPPLNRGPIVAAQNLVATAAEKIALGNQTGALAVDLETAVVAEACTRHGVPFGCVRAISDDVHTPLAPDLVALLKGGRVSFARLCAAVLRSPPLLVELWRLARRTRCAAIQLGQALGELLTLTLPWAHD